MQYGIAYRALGALGGSLILSACGGGGSEATPTPPPVTPPAAASFQSKFGTSFETKFNAAPTTEAADPAATDVPALSATTEPLDN